MRILLWHRSHKKVDTFGQLDECQILSHNVSLIILTLIIILYASLVVKVPFSSYPHLRMSDPSKKRICRFVILRGERVEFAQSHAT